MDGKWCHSMYISLLDAAFIMPTVPSPGGGHSIFSAAMQLVPSFGSCSVTLAKATQEKTPSSPHLLLTHRSYLPGRRRWYV